MPILPLALPSQTASQTASPAASAPPSLPLSPARLSLVPDLPAPFYMRDWRAVARGFDRMVYVVRQSPFESLVWSDPRRPGAYGVASYVGRRDGMSPEDHEGITLLGTILGGTMAGIDHTEHLPGALAFVSPEDGVVLNNIGTKSGNTFWYEIFPGITFAQIASRYPTWAEGQRATTRQASQWARAIRAMGGDFDHTAFDLRTMTPKDNGKWIEPDASAGMAYLTMLEGKRKGADPGLLAAARLALDALDARESNPMYEVLLPYGALAAARMNAEDGTTYDVARLVDWSLEPSPNRTGWGTVVGNWGGYDVGGLAGSVTDGGGYAFAMNTFELCGNLAPLARYDDRFSGDVAKYLLNAANAARLFYGINLDAAHESFDHTKYDPERTIPYEGLRRTNAGVAPRAMGDPLVHGWGKSDLCLYAGGYAGLLGAVVRPTDVPEIPLFDLRATDFGAPNGFPTSLLRNPFETARRVTINLGPVPVRLWDAVTNRVIAAKTKGRYALDLAPKQTVQLVLLPAEGKIAIGDRIATLNGQPVDFNAGRTPLPPRKARTLRDESVAVDAPQGTRTIDGKTDDWAGTPVAFHLDTPRGKAKADLSLAWDQTNLYVLVRQTAAGEDVREAPDAAKLRDEPWLFDNVSLTIDPAHGVGSRTFATAGDAQITLGWASDGKPGLAVSPGIAAEGLTVAASGSAARADRVLEARIAWADLFRSTTNGGRDGKGLVAPGFTFGFQPLFVDGFHARQSWIGGGQYIAPTGYDANSRTIRLKG